jgi:biotin operon repressor
MKKLFYQIDETRLGYLEVKEADVEKTIQKLRKEGCCIREIKSPHALIESLQHKKSTDTSDHQPYD